MKRPRPLDNKTVQKWIYQLKKRGIFISVKKTILVDCTASKISQQRISELKKRNGFKENKQLRMFDDTSS